MPDYTWISPPRKHPRQQLTRYSLSKSSFFGNVLFMPSIKEFSENGSGTSVAVETTDSSVPVAWEELARATAHPLRVSILEILGIDGGRTLSPSELSRELQIPLSNTNYHVTELAKAGLIELARQRQVRGATEHFYRLPASTLALKADPMMLP